MLDPKFTGAVAAALLLVLSGSARGQSTIQLGPSGASNDDQLVRLGDGADDTAIRIRNLSDSSGILGITINQGEPQVRKTDGSPSQFPFQMLDNTLTLDLTGIPTDQVRVRLRREFNGQLRRRGLRTDSVHVMRRILPPAPAPGNGGVPEPFWTPAVFTVRDQGNFRFLPGREADFVPGHFGISFQNSYAWVVVDNLFPSSDFGLAGFVPEPAGLLLIGAGSFLMLMTRRRV